MEAPYFPVDLDSLEGLVTFQPVEVNMTITVTPEVIVRTVGLEDARKIFKHTDIAMEKETHKIANGYAGKAGQEELQ